jgi:hypothetical protein
MTSGRSALYFVEKFIEIYHLINQDLAEECFTAISSFKDDSDIQKFLYNLLETEPTVLLFKLAYQMQLRPSRLLFDKSKNDPMLLLHFLSLFEVQTASDGFTLTCNDLNYILKHENLLLFDKVCKSFHLFIEGQENLTLQLDYTNPFSLLFLVRRQSSSNLLKNIEFKESEILNFTSIEDLLDAIERSISYSFELEDCHCSKHHECHDY